VEPTHRPRFRSTCADRSWLASRPGRHATVQCNETPLWRPCRDARPYLVPRRGEKALSADQLMAIAAVMRLFVEDDLVNGVSAERTIVCDACGAMRPAPGFIRYEQRQLCNPCATAYETRRARGLVRTIGAHLDDIHARRDR
jgi:hypothetical protein